MRRAVSSSGSATSLRKLIRSWRSSVITGPPLEYSMPSLLLARLGLGGSEVAHACDAVATSPSLAEARGRPRSRCRLARPRRAAAESLGHADAARQARRLRPALERGHRLVPRLRHRLPARGQRRSARTRAASAVRPATGAEGGWQRSRTAKDAQVDRDRVAPSLRTLSRTSPRLDPPRQPHRPAAADIERAVRI